MIKMGNEKTRRDNMSELYGRICSIKADNGDYDKEILEELINKFCYEKGIKRRTVNDYINTLKGAGLLKL